MTTSDNMALKVILNVKAAFCHYTVHLYTYCSSVHRTYILGLV